MSKEAHDFDEKLKFGLEWEEEVKERLTDVILSLNLESIQYEDKPGLQRAGIDHIIRQDETGIDVKTLSNKYTGSGLLPFEVMSVIGKAKPGWFWDSESDLVVWVYPNEVKTNLHHVGYLMPLQNGLRDWFDENAKNYDFKKIPNEGRFGEYETGIRLVNIDDIPDEYLVEFDPRLPTDRETPQSDIMEWAKS